MSLDKAAVELSDEPPRFNLIDEPWIPVQRPDGTRCELGIRDTLLQAEEIAAIQDGSPLVVAALHRLLLAVLYRALQGPTDGTQAKAWFQTGWPIERVEHYLQGWRDRFWLLHPRYPFAQIPDFEPKAWRAWTVLAAEHNADNAKVLFDHVDVTRAGGIASAHAARWLLAAQTFSVSAGKSELAHTGTAPSAKAAMALPVGQHLRDTLSFMLVPQSRVVIERDLALWERKPEAISSLKNECARPVDGYADRYTWRTRSIRLRADDRCRVTEVAFASGVDAQAENQGDPMVAYRIDKERGRLPIILRERGLWREFDSLLPDAEDLAPQVVVNAIFLARGVPERFPRGLLVLGQANDKAKIEYWRMEQFHLPEALRGDRSVRKEVHDLLAEAEDVQTSLWKACAAFARAVLSRGPREPDTKDIRGFVSQMPAIGAYWSRLEARFQAVLRDYTEARHWEDIRWSWLNDLRHALNATWDEFTASVDSGDAWAIRALIRAEREVRQRSAALTKDIASLDPKKSE